MIQTRLDSNLARVVTPRLSERYLSHMSVWRRQHVRNNPLDLSRPRPARTTATATGTVWLPSLGAKADDFPR